MKENYIIIYYSEIVMEKVRILKLRNYLIQRGLKAKANRIFQEILLIIYYHTLLNPIKILNWIESINIPIIEKNKKIRNPRYKLMKELRKKNIKAWPLKMNIARNILKKYKARNRNLQNKLPFGGIW